MKTATVADLRNDFKKVSAWLEVGEKVEITKRGKPYAVLTKAEERVGKARPRWNIEEHQAKLDEIWGDRIFSDREVAEMRKAEAGQFEQE